MEKESDGTEGERLAPQAPSRANGRSACVGPAGPQAQRHGHEREELVGALFGY